MCHLFIITEANYYFFVLVMSQRDMMACAQTGSGKTAAFLLPMIHKLLEESVDPHMGLPATPEVIVVSPTRELALQITKEAMKFAKGSKLGAYTVYGGTQVGHQRERLREKNINIVVATPGRLLQFIRDETISLRNLMFFVLDEADRMLDMGFQVKNFEQHFFFAFTLCLCKCKKCCQLLTTYLIQPYI